MEYYGREPSSDFFMHYGIKGMKWGVRKAIEKGNNKALTKHYKKAIKKLGKLENKADIIRNLRNRKDAPVIMSTALIPTSAGVAMPIIAKSSNHKLNTGDKITAGFNALAGAGMMGAGAYNLISGHRRTSAKGHAKAVKKIENWQKEMRSTFKGTKYGKATKDMPDYKDEYRLYEYGTLGTDKNGNEIPYRVPTVSINGSSLTRNTSNSKAKQIFKKRLTDSPQTQKMSDSKVQLIVYSPSGNGYSAEEVNSLIKVKKNKRNKT